MDMKVRLGDYIREYSQRNKADEDIPVYSVTNSQGFCQGYFDKEVASKDKTTYKIVPKGCFAYNPSRINVGSVDWQRHKEKVIVSPLYNVFSVLPGLNRQYLYYYLKSDITLYYIKELATGSVRDNLKLSALYEFEINLPSEKVQKQIVQILDQVAAIKAARQKQLDALDELVKARFIEMFGDPEENPFNWRVVNLNDVCSSIVRGPFGSALKKDFFVPWSKGVFKVYEQKNAIKKSATLGTYYITEKKFRELQRFECVAGDIIMSCSGTMGEFYQLPQNCEKGIINQALCKFTLNNKILPVFFLEYMKHTITNLETKGSGIKNVAAVSFIKRMPVTLPSIDVQKRFVSFVHQVEQLKSKIRESLAETETLFQSLMQEYFG